MFSKLTTDWFSLNGKGVGETRVYAITDVHGRADLFEAMLTQIKNQATEPFELVLLGDYIDRGPESLKCLDLARAAGDITGAEHTTILPGNHELMMLDVAHMREREIRLWIANGGETLIEELERKTGTIETYKDLSNALLKFIDPYWLNYEFDTSKRIGDVLFVHAGISPYDNLEDFLSLPPQNARETAQYAEHWAWIRWSFLKNEQPWPGDLQTVVHGHTPALTNPLRDPNTLTHNCARPEGLNRVNLDIGAASHRQAAFGEFKGNQARVHALYEDGGWLP